MRGKLFWSVVALGLATGVTPAMSSELIGGGEYEWNKQGALIRSSQWSYLKPPATPDTPGRPPVRAAGTRQDSGYSLSNEERKAAIRKASGYRDPPGTRELR